MNELRHPIEEASACADNSGAGAPAEMRMWRALKGPPASQPPPVGKTLSPARATRMLLGACGLRACHDATGVGAVRRAGATGHEGGPVFEVLHHHVFRAPTAVSPFGLGELLP